MTEVNRSAKRKIAATVASIALFATACGGGGTISSADRNAAETAASTNEAALQLTSDVGSTELLDAADGTIKTLNDVVTDDRAVLVWYWAPH